MKQLISKLTKIQSELKAPKSQFNKFGNYNYRNQEDILEAVKPLLKREGLSLTISDEVVEVGGRIYIKSTATITDGEHSTSNTAYAREDESVKGMSVSQITGSSSSYARKYCLNGLFLIDDTRDADATNTHGKESTVDDSQKSANPTVTTTAPSIKSFKRPTKPSSSDDLI